MSAKQLCTQLAFKASDLLADCGLGDMKLIGGRREVQVTSGSLEHSQTIQGNVVSIHERNSFIAD